MANMKILPSGDCALVVEFGDIIAPEINDQVLALEEKLKIHPIGGIQELVPTFRSLLIHYDPAVLSFSMLSEKIRELEKHPLHIQAKTKRILQIPCCYGSHFGPDLAELERYTGLTRDEIIALHSSVDYKIFMLGFLPGFVYLGGLDKRLEAPRLSTPRIKIPRGSVGIGGSQTGVYPLDSPGGWRLIGSTPVEFYQPEKKEPVLCSAGEYIRFIPINSSDYYDIRQMVINGTYTPDILSA